MALAWFGVQWVATPREVSHGRIGDVEEAFVIWRESLAAPLEALSDVDMIVDKQDIKSRIWGKISTWTNTHSCKQFGSASGTSKAISGIIYSIAGDLGFGREVEAGMRMLESGLKCTVFSQERSIPHSPRKRQCSVPQTMVTRYLYTFANCSVVW